MFVRGSQASLAGGIVGMLVSFAVATVSMRAAIYGAGAVTAAMGLVAIAFMPETGFVPEPRGDRSHARAMFDTAASGFRLVRRVPVLVLLVSATVFVGAASEGFDRLSQAHLLRNVGVMARTLTVLSVVQIVAGLAFALTGVFAVAVVALWLLSLARTLVFPVYATWLNRNIDDSRVRATVNSIASQADEVGQTAGGPVVGAIGNAISLPAALATSALFYVPALGLYARSALSGQPLETGAEAVAPVR